MRTFESLSEREILALAISLEEEDERIYADFAEGLRQDFPASAALFEGMREEEATHRHRLFELYRSKFGEHIPLIRRQDVKGFVNRPAIWLLRPLQLTILIQLLRLVSPPPWGPESAWASPRLFLMTEASPVGGTPGCAD